MNLQTYDIKNIITILCEIKLLQKKCPCKKKILENKLYIRKVDIKIQYSLSFTCRYYAIVHPLSAMKVNSKSRTKKIIAATWIIPAILATPYCFSRAEPFTISSELGTLTGELCSDRFDELDGHTGDFRRIFFVILFVVMYFIPLAIIVVTCTKIAICLTRPFVVGNSATYKQDPTSKRRHEVNKRKVSVVIDDSVNKKECQSDK